MAFQSQNELKAHTEMVHTARGTKVASHNVNSWLNFKGDDDEVTAHRKRDQQRPRNELKDKEGVDFSFFFSQKYQMTHQKHNQHRSNRQNKPKEESKEPSETKEGYLHPNTSSETRLSYMY